MLAERAKYEGLKGAVEDLIERYGYEWCSDGKGAVKESLAPHGVSLANMTETGYVGFQVCFTTSEIIKDESGNYPYKLNNDIEGAFRTALLGVTLPEGMTISIDEITLDDWGVNDD